MSGRKPQKPERACAISVFPRLHITLIGMDASGYRRNGGLGFSLNEPSAIVRVVEAAEFSLRDTRRCPLCTTEQVRLANIAYEFAEKPLQIEISGEMPSHYGFGSATGIRLATLEAIAAAENRDVDRPRLIRTSGRGGTSGIGVTTYFGGGLVVDLGIKNTGLLQMPSSLLEGTRPTPLVLTRLEMPPWRIGLCVPLNIKSKTEDEEVAFFKRACPISSAATKDVLYHIIYGAVASAIEQDFAGFCAAIKAIQNCTWKRLERELYGPPLLSIENQIYMAGASAVGMSSLGPGLFYFGNDLEQITLKLRSVAPEHLWIEADCYNSARTLASQ